MDLQGKEVRSRLLEPFEASPMRGMDLHGVMESELSKEMKSRNARIDSALHSDLMRLLMDLAQRLATESQWSQDRIQKVVLEPIARLISQSEGKPRDQKMVSGVVSLATSHLQSLRTAKGGSFNPAELQLIEQKISTLVDAILFDLNDVNSLREFSTQETKKINSVLKFTLQNSDLMEAVIKSENGFHSWISSVSTQYLEVDPNSSLRLTYMNEWLRFVSTLTPYAPAEILRNQIRSRNTNSFEDRFSRLIQNNLFPFASSTAAGLINRNLTNLKSSQSSVSESIKSHQRTNLEIRVDGKKTEFWIEVSYQKEPMRADKQFALIRESQKIPGAKPASLRYELIGDRQYLIITTEYGDDEIWVQKLLTFIEERLALTY